MSLIDTTSPGFQISVISVKNEPRIQKQDSNVLGQVLSRVSDVTPRILGFTFEDDEEKHDILKLKVDNSDLYYFLHPAWIKGNLIRFFFGYPGRVSKPRVHTIDAVSGFLTLEITAIQETGLVNTAKNRLFENMTRADVVRKIAQRGNEELQGVTSLDIDESGLADEGPRDWQQAKQSDWQFLQHLAEDPGYEVYVEGEVLHFHPRRFNGSPVRRYEYFYGIGDLIDFDIKEWRTTDRPSETVVESRDAIERQNRSAAGSNETTQRDTLGNQNTLVITRGTSGALKTENRLSGKTIDTSPDPDQGSITQQANTRYTRQEQGEIKASAKIIGDPFLDAKKIIEIVGISPLLSGKFYVTKVTHEISQSDGYVCNLDLLKNAVGQFPSSDPPSLNPSNAEENDKVVQDERGQVIVRDPVTGALRHEGR